MRKKIDLERLRAAIRAGGFGSVNEVAQTAGIVHTTLSRAFAADIRRRAQPWGPLGHQPVMMTSRTLSRLSRVLRVPVEWLTGEMDSLPFVPKHGILSRRSQDDSEEVTAARVRLSHLLSSADAALRRDLDTWNGREASEAYASWGGGILFAVRELADPLSWLWAMVSSTDPDPGALLTPDVLRNGAAVSWLEQALEPWFKGRAHLNARILRELFLALSADPQRRKYTSPIEEADIIRALEMYDASAAGGPLQTPPPPTRVQRRRGRGLRKWKRDKGDSGT